MENKKVILLRGKAGVGKSYLSDLLSKKLNVAIIRKDDIYDALANYVDDHEVRNKISYDVMHKMIESNINSDADVIVDAPFHYLNQVERFDNWIKKKNGKLISFCCNCSDEELWAKRFNLRNENPKANNLITDFNELKGHYKDLRTIPMVGEVELDTKHDSDDLLLTIHDKIMEG